MYDMLCLCMYISCPFTAASCRETMQTVMQFLWCWCTPPTELHYTYTVANMLEYRQYQTSNDADDLLLKLFSTGEVDYSLVLNTLRQSVNTHTDVYESISNAYNEASIHINYVRQLIEKQILAVEYTYPTEFCLTIQHVDTKQVYVTHGTSLRNMYSSYDDMPYITAQSWFWSKADLEKLHKRLPDLQETSEDLLYPIKPYVLCETCLAYITSHRVYTANQYLKQCSQHVKQKVPGCYIIRNDICGKIYVGQSADLTNRVKQHLNGRQSGGDELDYDIAVNRVPVTIRHIPLTKSGYNDLNELERLLIKAYDSLEPNGYNKTRGNGEH